MRLGNWTKKLSTTLVAGGLMMPLAPTVVNAASLGVNLITDPGFEDVSAGRSTAEGRLRLDSWRDGLWHGSTNSSADLANGGVLSGGGDRYFSAHTLDNRRGHADLPGEVSQRIDLSGGDTGAAIATGNARYSMGGFFSTYRFYIQWGIFEVDFQDVNGDSLLTDRVTPGANVRTWTHLTGGGTVPAGATQALLSVYGDFDRTPGEILGFIDNVHFQITAGVPEPSSFVLLALAGVPLLGLRRK